ncbi:MAG TPA: lantibiotic dehydratase [Streptosporangiaceae bacterium]|nr:lantibiotic dehydratase [Streptosporangiaceae bacterium]
MSATPRPAADGTRGHLAALPGGGWQVWREALLRTTGFPAEYLDAFRAPGLAQAADRLLAADGGDPAAAVAFAAALAAAEANCSAQVRDIAADPLFREAIAWQNPDVLPVLDKVVALGLAPPRNRRQRERERVIARYWQRYCAKTETIGFFGPVCWAQVDPAVPQAVAEPGQSLLSNRRVYLEHWALTEWASRFAASLENRRWLPPSLQPHLTLDGRQVLDPAKPPASLTKAEADVLALTDGRRPAIDIAVSVTAAPRCGLRRAEEVYLLLDRLVERGLVRWTLEVPVRIGCEQLLRDRIAGIRDVTTRTAALAELDRLSRARDRLADAAGRAEAVRAAVAMLDAEFAALTGRSAVRRPGETYAARRVYWEEATRDLRLEVGAAVLEAIGTPLAVILHAARWLSAAMARAYLDALAALYRELAAELGTADVPLGQLWFLAQGLFYGTAERPAQQVIAEFAQRWAKLFGLGPGASSAREVRADGASLLPEAASIFAAPRPGWAGARVHSPDLQICSASLADLQAGEFFVVLGEMHVAWATNACGGAVSCHPDAKMLADFLRADIGPGQVRLLLPAEWPRNTPRLAMALDSADDVLLGIYPAPGADHDRLLPVTSVSVRDTGGELAARARDGRTWPLAAIFAQPLSEVAVEAFKLAGDGPHSPRIVIDSMVAARETWRATIGQTGLLEAQDEAQRYLAVRRWQHALGLPDRVFVKLATETKPMFADLTSPLYVASFHHMLRAAARSAGPDAGLTVTEMLPGPDHAWVPDSAGRRYLSELRLQVCDPVPADPGPAGPADDPGGQGE